MPPAGSTQGKRQKLCGRHALKEFRAVATRYDKTDTSYTATIHLAAAIPLAWWCRSPGCG